MGERGFEVLVKKVEDGYVLEASKGTRKINVNLTQVKEDVKLSLDRGRELGLTVLKCEKGVEKCIERFTRLIEEVA